MAYVKQNKGMKWMEAIVKVLREAGGGPMSVEDITSNIINKGYYSTRSQHPETTVNSYLSKNKKLFQNTEKGHYKLIGTPAPATPTTIARVAPAVVRSSTSVRPCTSYSPGDPKYKCASAFVNSSVLSQLEMDLLELIVNFRLPLANGEVCFAADILDNFEVQFLEKGIRDQSIDAALLEQKLSELNEKIAKTKRELQNNPQREELYGLLERMSSAAKKAQELLNKASDGKVEFEYPIFGEFVLNETEKPKVVIYLKSIDESIKKRNEEYPWRSESRWKVMPAVFIHEMFHAWNYFNAEQNSRSVLAIDEPMVEFETLYFLKKLETFTESHSNPLHKNVLSVRVNRKFRVKKKQQSIGDVAAYGFGYYLYEKLSERDVDSITWIETYSKKSASIKSSQAVKNVEKALIPIYPFKSEKQVMRWFERIIFDAIATSKTAGKSATDKVDLDVSLRDLVLACIKIIGRKCFAAQELYAFAPVFKVCLPECKDIEKALKQQLDELVKEGFLEALPHDCYSMKLAGVEVKHKNPTPTTPATLVPAPTKSKGGRKKAASIPFAVKFPDDDVEIKEETAVSTYIESLKYIGLSKVQHLGLMHQSYDLVSDVEHPLNREKNLQHYVDTKYIYTKLGNQSKKGYLYQIANELKINIEIYDI